MFPFDRVCRYASVFKGNNTATGRSSRQGTSHTTVSRLSYLSWLNIASLKTKRYSICLGSQVQVSFDRPPSARRPSSKCQVPIPRNYSHRSDDNKVLVQQTSKPRQLRSPIDPTQHYPPVCDQQRQFEKDSCFLSTVTLLSPCSIKMLEFTTS